MVPTVWTAVFATTGCATVAMMAGWVADVKTRWSGGTIGPRQVRGYSDGWDHGMNCGGDDCCDCRGQCSCGPIHHGQQQIIPGLMGHGGRLMGWR